MLRSPAVSRASSHNFSALAGCGGTSCEGSAATWVTDSMAGFTVPAGYSIVIGGEAENSAEAVTDLASVGVPLHPLVLSYCESQSRARYH